MSSEHPEGPSNIIPTAYISAWWKRRNHLPVSYGVIITHFSDGSMGMWIEDVTDTPSNREKICDDLREVIKRLEEG